MKSKRGRKRAPTSTRAIELQRARQRKHYAKGKGHGPGDYHEIPKSEWEKLREKWKAFEGVRMEKSINTPVFLSKERDSFASKGKESMPKDLTS